MANHPTLRSVFGQKVEAQAAQNLIGILVFPEELHLANGDQVRVGPNLDKEELAQGKNLGFGVLLVFDGFVKDVGGMMATGGPNKLKESKRLVHKCIHHGVKKKLLLRQKMC